MDSLGVIAGSAGGRGAGADAFRAQEMGVEAFGPGLPAEPKELLTPVWNRRDEADDAPLEEAPFVEGGGWNRCDDLAAPVPERCLVRLRQADSGGSCITSSSASEPRYSSLGLSLILFALGAINDGLSMPSSSSIGGLEGSQTGSTLPIDDVRLFSPVSRPSLSADVYLPNFSSRFVSFGEPLPGKGAEEDRDASPSISSTRAERCSLVKVS